MSDADERAARVAFVLEALTDAVQDSVLGLRNMTAELVAHGLDREAKRLATIAALLDCADDLVDAVEFVSPTLRSISWRLYEAQVYQPAHDLQTIEGVLASRSDALQEQTSPIDVSQ